MATRRRSRFSTLTNTVSDINQRLKYVEKRRSYSRLARQVVRRQNIQPKAVATDQLANKSVTNDILDDDSVTSDKIASGAVTTDEIAEGTILAINIGPDAIQNVNMGGGQVDGRVLADNTVESRHIKNGEVKTEDINPGAVTNDILAGGITNDKLAGSISNDKLAGGITNDKLAGSISNDKLAGGITNDKLAGNISNDKLAGGITNAKLAGGITNDKLAGGITNGKLAGGITRDKINPQIISTVTAGTGLSGGGSANSVTLRVNFDSVARSGHGHSEYASSGHGHGSTYASVNHTHSGSTTGTVGGDVPGHRHTISGLGNVSSRRLKKDIEDYSIDPEKVLKLNLKRFRYLNHARRYQNNLGNRDWSYGYIAEEVLDSGLEELLIYDDQGEPFGLNYGLVGVLSLELVRSLKEQVDNLNQRVLELERGL